MRPPRDIAEVKLALGKVMADVHDGRPDTKVAKCMTYTATALLKAIEACDLEVRIKRLEELARGPQGEAGTVGT